MNASKNGLILMNPEPPTTTINSLTTNDQPIEKEDITDLE